MTTTKTQTTKRSADLCNFESADILRAAQHGYNFKRLAAFIASISANFEEKEIINSFDINNKYIWLYVHEQSGNYKDMQSKYNNCKGWATSEKLKEKSQKEILLNLLECATNSADFKKSNKPQDGYFIKELENNKPTTLLKAKNNNFVCFVVFADYGKINSIDIDENKKESEKDFFKLNNNYWDAAIIRKHAQKIYAIYNKQMPQYKELCKIITTKRKERAKNEESTPKEAKRYFYTDASFLSDLLKSENCLHLYNSFNHNSLLKNEFDICAPGLEIKYNSITFLKTTEPMTRKQVFNYCVDSSGFCVLFYREKLLRRLTTLKAEKARIKREQERASWAASDKTQLLNEVNEILYKLSFAIMGRVSMAELMNDNSFEALKKYRDLYKRFSYQKDFTRYENITEWRAKFEEKMKDYNFYNRAINKGVLDRVACAHHYELQPDGNYKNISKDNYFSNPERYLQAF